MEKQNKSIDIDSAWNSLHARLQNDHLLTPYSYRLVARRFIKYIAVLVIIFIGGITGMYVNEKINEPDKQVISNNEAGTSLVTTLTDGTIVYLANGATLTYPGVFEKNTRKVSLTGEAMFEVKGYKQYPFEVETPKATVKVTGTVFNIKSLSGKENFELNVQNGIVEVTHKTNQNKITVHQGEGIQLQKGKWQKNVSHVNLYTLYTRKMKFKDEALSDMLQIINKTGDKPIVLSSQEASNRKITATFAGNTSESMAELICIALNLQQTIRNDTIYISQP